MEFVAASAARRQAIDYAYPADPAGLAALLGSKTKRLGNSSEVDVRMRDGPRS